MSKRLCCLYCGSDYSADRSLKRHCQSFPEHRPSSASVCERAGNNVKPANVSIKEFLEVGERYRDPRLCHLGENLSMEDAKLYLLPAVAKCMTLYELFTNYVHNEDEQDLSSSCLTNVLSVFLNLVKQKHCKELRYALHCIGFTNCDVLMPVPPLHSPLISVENTPLRVRPITLTT